MIGLIVARSKNNVIGKDVYKRQAQVVCQQPESQFSQFQRSVLECHGKSMSLIICLLYTSSGGQQQRVAIARALASDAHVLLADEPTGNLDETTADEIIALLKKTAHELGKCVVVVTHSKHLAEEADEILEIKNGAISFLSE